MKKINMAFLIRLLLIIGLTPTIVMSDQANPHQQACLETPDNNIASTAMSCAFALQFFVNAQEPIADAVQQRINALKKEGEFHTILRNQILEAMKLNRRAFQSEKVLKRYAESRDLLADNTDIFEQCGLPRDNNGHPLPQYLHSITNPDHGTKADYSESNGVLDCLETKSGLAGVRAEPLAQHYYCTFPGNSPEIRSCFTFQIRVSSNTRSNSHKNIFMKDHSTGEQKKLDNARKEWIFAGTQSDYQDAKDSKAIPQHVIKKVANYCSFDGRAARVKDLSVEPPTTYWHTSFLENYLQEVQSHQDPADTNESLIEDYIQAKSDAKRIGSKLLDIDQIDANRDEQSNIKAPLCWINQTQRSIFQLMLSPALAIYFDRNDQASIIKDYYQCNNDSVMQEYNRSQRKIRNYCPDNFDSWND